MIIHEELGRWKVRGFDDGVIGGMVISVPTILNFGTPEMKQKVFNVKYTSFLSKAKNMF
jgi:hypothetical protein